MNPAPVIYAVESRPPDATVIALLTWFAVGVVATGLCQWRARHGREVDALAMLLGPLAAALLPFLYARRRWRACIEVLRADNARLRLNRRYEALGHAALEEHRARKQMNAHQCPACASDPLGCETSAKLGRRYHNAVMITDHIAVRFDADPADLPRSAS